MDQSARKDIANYQWGGWVPCAEMLLTDPHPLDSVLVRKTYLSVKTVNVLARIPLPPLHSPKSAVQWGGESPQRFAEWIRGRLFLRGSQKQDGLWKESWSLLTAWERRVSSLTMLDSCCVSVERALILVLLLLINKAALVFN